MDSPSKDMETKISPSLPIPELIGLIRYSFLQSEFNQVQNILMEREKNMKTELENLQRDCDLWKAKVHLMENAQGLSKFEEEFRRYKRECEDLNEQNLRLAEDLRLMRDREEKAEERSQGVSNKYSKMVVEKNKTISELNATIYKLKIRELENERMIRECQDKMNVLDIRVLEITKEKEHLRLEKLVVDEIVGELRLQKSDSDTKLIEFADRMGKVEETIATVLNVNMEDFPNLIRNFDSLAEMEGSRVNIEHSENGISLARSLANDINDDFMSHGARSTCNSNERGSKKDDENLVQSSGTKEDEADSIQTSPGAQSLSHLPQEECNIDQIKENEVLQESGFMNLVEPSSKEDGVDENNTTQISPGRQSAYDSPQDESNGISMREENKKIRESVSRGGDFGSNDRVPIAEIIVISDSDDENEIAHPKSVENPSSRQTKKRWKEASSMRSDQNIKRCRLGSHNDSLPIDKQKEKEGEVQPPITKSMAFDSETPRLNNDGISDGDATDSDCGSCSSRAMEKLLAEI